MVKRRQRAILLAVPGVWLLWSVSSLLQVTLWGGGYQPVCVRLFLLTSCAFGEVVSLVLSFVSLLPANRLVLFACGVSPA
eukprot:2282313-Prymnesium_polylepis.1